jgi:uncharacterized membrane protein YphA (DoxX/SURF4 family)
MPVEVTRNIRHSIRPPRAHAAPQRAAVTAPQAVSVEKPARGANRVAAVRIAFGGFWAIDAWYKWQPAFQRQAANMVTRPVRGAPHFLSGWFQFWSHLIAPHAALFGVSTAIVETLIAAALIVGFARRPLYLLGAVFSFLIWSVPEAFGRFWTAGQTDLGTSIMYVFIFLALYALDAAPGAGGWSVDRAIMRRIPGWRIVSQP